MNSIREYIFSTVLTAAMLGLGASATAQTAATADPRTFSQQQEAFAAVVPAAASSLQTGVWADRPDSLYVPGETARFFVSVSEPAYLVVYSVNTLGLTFPLLPLPQGYVKTSAAGVVEIPVAGGRPIVVSEPYGADLIKVVATDSLAAVEALRAAGALQNNVRSQDMVRALKQVQAQHPTAKWSMAQHSAGVVASRPGSAPTAVATVPSVQPVAPVAPAGVPVVNPINTQPAAPVPAVSPAQQALNLQNLSSGFGLRIEMDRDTYRIGEPQRVSVTAERDCYLTVVDVPPSATHETLLRPTYPNGSNKALAEIKLKAGRTLWLPPAGSGYAQTTSGELGQHQMLGICSEKRGLLDTLLGRTGDRSTLEPIGSQPVSLQSLLQGSADARSVARAVDGFVVTPMQ